MGLIDTDAIKLPKGFFEKVNNVPKFYEWLNTLPSIEAIPVDWILTWWAHQGVPSLSHCLENTDEVIRTMLRDWEKEYETD